MTVLYVLVGIILALELLNIIANAVDSRRRRRRRDGRGNSGWMPDLPLDAVGTWGDGDWGDGGNFFEGGDWGNWN